MRMSSLTSVISSAAGKWRRDAALPLSARADKAVSYAAGLLSAPWLLRHVNEWGQGTRVVGRPCIENQGSITIGRDTLIRSATLPVELFTTHGAVLKIGSGCVINSGVSLAATRSITLGDRVFLGTLVFVMDNSFHDVLDREIHPDGKPVVIEDDVWIGVKASVLPGVRIGRGAVVGAHALVTRDVPPFSLVAGIPARVIRSLAAPGAPP